MPEVRSHPAPGDGPRESGRATSGRRGRRRGVEIKAGTVKQARLEAGLSLGQVAGTEISRTAIYFVETGKAKPSMETLKLIAARTGRPLDYFLSNPSTMEARATVGTAEMERSITSGDPAGAIAAGLGLLAGEGDPDVAARIKFLMATAHLRLAQPLEARRLASAARAYFEQSGDVLMTAECLGSEASAAYLMQDPGALALAEGALATCRTLKPVPVLTESRLLGVLASVHTTNENWEAAIKTYEQAIAAGEVVQDLRRLSLVYSGLSVAYKETGQFSRAAQYAQRAIAIHETLQDRVSLARSENNLGLLLLMEGKTREARSHLERSLRIFEETGVESDKPAVLLSLCEAAFAESDGDQAARLAREALDLALRVAQGATAADAHIWLGTIAAASGDHVAADREFAHAFDGLDAVAGSARRLSRAHSSYADILEARGDLAGAIRHLKQALATHPVRRSTGAMEASSSG
ncbi:MAG TPA: tetratricopeptide repeat protein [Candidatus Eisenbacteria bacterium]|nr:tetratricopeptide repeat protein [Candidatus Eisenbacteria bacterium]